MSPDACGKPAVESVFVLIWANLRITPFPLVIVIAAVLYLNGARCHRRLFTSDDSASGECARMSSLGCPSFPLPGWGIRTKQPAPMSDPNLPDPREQIKEACSEARRSKPSSCFAKRCHVDWRRQRTRWNEWRRSCVRVILNDSNALYQGAAGACCWRVASGSSSSPRFPTVGCEHRFRRRGRVSALRSVICQELTMCT